MPGTEPDSIATGDFTLPELADLTGIDSRTLHNWMRRGILTPSRERARGSGTRNVFDRRDALFLVILADLRHGGAEITALEEIAPALREFAAHSAGEELLMINGDVRLVVNTAQLAADLDQDGPAFVYAMSRARRAVERFGEGTPDMI
jgi:DNA-binding transcriptional MerR regulator